MCLTVIFVLIGGFTCTVALELYIFATVRGHTQYSCTFIFNLAGETVPSLLSLACEKFYHTRVVKPEEDRSDQFVIRWVQNISMMLALSELLCSYRSGFRQDI